MCVYKRNQEKFVKEPTAEEKQIGKGKKEKKKKRRKYYQTSINSGGYGSLEVWTNSLPSAGE